jgi:hypothetical protein
MLRRGCGSKPAGIQRLFGPRRSNPPQGAWAGFEMIGLKNFRRDNI